MKAIPFIIVGLLVLIGGIIMWGVPEYYRRKAEPYMSDFDRATAQYGLPPGLLARVAQEESGFDPTAVSPAGAQGLFQFMPATAADFGIDPFDAKASTYAAAKYLRQLYDKFGSWQQALAAYNWGAGNLQRKDLPDGIFGNQLPDETAKYVADIAGDLGLA